MRVLMLSGRSLVVILVVVVCSIDIAATKTKVSHN